MKKQEQSIEDFVGKARRAKKVEKVCGHLDNALKLGADKKYIASVYEEISGRTEDPATKLTYFSKASALYGSQGVLAEDDFVCSSESADDQAMVDIAEGMTGDYNPADQELVLETQPQTQPQGFLERAKAKGQELSDKLSDPAGRQEIKERVVEGTKDAYHATAQAAKKGYSAAAPVVQGWWGKAKEGAKNIADKINPPAPTIEDLNKKEAERTATNQAQDAARIDKGTAAWEKFQAKYGRRK
ncbi:hypothetical protein HY837_06565 [archaeon]|nr:hypothetical protein [archaeon]